MLDPHPIETHADPYALPSDPGPSARTLRRVAIGVAIVALIVVVFGVTSRISAVDKLHDVSTESAIPTVSVVVPKLDSSSGSLTLPGNIQALNSAPIYARTNGYVRRWLVDIGDKVKTGQVLAILDAPDVDQQLAQAKADYETARANQNLAVTTSRRWTELLAKDAVSHQEADEKRGDLAAKVALSNAALANVRRLQAEQGFTKLTAPFAGVVTSRSAQIGALVVSGNAAAQPLFTVSDVSKMRIYVRVPQNASASVAPGIAANLSLPEFPNRTFPATMTRSAQSVDAQSGAVLIELQAANPDGALKPGAYAQVTFNSLHGQSSGQSLPGSAILYGNNGPSVAVVDSQGRVTVKPVTIGRDEGAKVIIATGLAPTDRVIDSPPDAIRSGDQVRVQQAAGNAH